MTPMNAIQAAFSSPRMNRLMLGTGAAILAAGAVTFVFAFVGGSDNTNTGADPGFRPVLPVHSEPLKNADGRTIRAYRQLDPQVRSTVRTFISTAVARKHLEDSWAVTAPSLKVGFTYEQWKKAKALPIIPYPLDDINRVQYALQLATTQEILIEVGIGARRETKVRPATFQLGLIPVGTGANVQWLVDYWMPRWTPIIPIQGE